MKRAIIALAALLLSGAIGSAARAQTPAYAANFNRYLSNHPGAARWFATNPGTINAPSYPTGYTGMQNYSGAYQSQYMKNLATYQNYLTTHPGFAANSGMGNVPSYMANYPGQYPYPDPTQQLAGSPLTALIAPFMSGYPAMQNYPGGYGGTAAPIYQSPYAGTSYPPPAQWGDDDDDGYHRWHHHHHHFDGDGYGPYGGGAGPYGSGGYSGTPISQAWNHRYFAGNRGPGPAFNGRRFFGMPSGAGRARWGRNH